MVESIGEKRVDLHCRYLYDLLLLVCPKNFFFRSWIVYGKVYQSEKFSIAYGWCHSVRYAESVNPNSNK